MLTMGIFIGGGIRCLIIMGATREISAFTFQPLEAIPLNHVTELVKWISIHCSIGEVVKMGSIV